MTGFKINLHFTHHSRCDAGVQDWFVEPCCVGAVHFVQGLNDFSVKIFSCCHKSVAKIGMLVEREVSTPEAELILMVALSKLLWHTTTWLLKVGLEDNLCRTTAQIKDRRRRCVIGSTDLPEQVVSRDPSIHALVFAIHNFHASFLF